jgi:ribosome-associated protein YbcJ (S4-like RNA binding protein)
MAKKWFTTTDLLLQFMKFLGCNVSAGKWKETIEEQNIDYNNFQINFY